MMVKNGPDFVTKHNFGVSVSYGHISSSVMYVLFCLGTLIWLFSNLNILLFNILNSIKECAHYIHYLAIHSDVYS